MTSRKPQAPKKQNFQYTAKSNKNSTLQIDFFHLIEDCLEVFIPHLIDTFEEIYVKMLLNLQPKFKKTTLRKHKIEVHKHNMNFKFSSQTISYRGNSCYLIQNHVYLL